MGKRGVNRAQIKDGLDISLYESCVEKGDKAGTCVFISHKSSDKVAAAAIAGYIKDNGIDVYIDIDDNGLQIATINNDPEGVVAYIQKGLKQSTHILALISDDTKESWWVPYEIGYGENAGKEIASMILEQDGLDYFPEYLKIEKRLFDADDFVEFVKKVKWAKSRYGAIFEETHPTIMTDAQDVSKYIKKVRLR